MAAPAARDRKDNQPYEDGGGYGKFRKRPFRRGQATPYDRPSTAIRNAGLQSTNGSGNGWLSKLVDPAQRLLVSGAHRLFASLLRKRLPPPPPAQSPEQEVERGVKQKQLEAISKGKQVETVPMFSSKAAVYSQGEPSHMYDHPGSSHGGAVTDLESMLQQKRFTRHEIDRLTALLQSRVVDLPVENEKKSELVPPNSFLLHDKEFPGTPVKDNGIGNQLMPAPHVLDQDVASPAELAKAYMGSRPSKVSPSMLGLPSHPWKDDSAPQVSPIFRGKGPTMSTIYRSSGKAGLTENGFMTPRPRGRSAVYSMARTPYSRTQSTIVIQGAGTDVFAERGSSYQSVRENDRFSGSKQGTLKRRSSVLESDMGSTSPIRRIRQKANLMSAGALSVRGTHLKSDPTGHMALTAKTVAEDEPSKENGDYSIQNSGFPPVSSKSSEMASKILQQLDVLVSSREKSPAKLSPSMLRGQALRSLEKIDSSKFLESAQNSTQSNERNGSVLDAERPMPEKEDKIEQNGPSKVDVDGGKLVASKIVEKTNSFDAGVVTTGVKFSSHSPRLKKPGFRMSVNEDFPEIDDDDSAGNNSTRWGTGDMKLISSSDESKAVEGAMVDKTPVLSGANPLSSSILSKKDIATDNGPTSVGTSYTSSLAAPLSTEVVNHAAIPSQSAAVYDNASIGISSSGEKAGLRIESNGASEKVPLFSASSSLAVANNGFSPKFGGSSGSQLGSSQRVLPVAAVADPVAKQPGVDTDADRNKPVVSFKAIATPPSSVFASSPAVGMFSFGSGLQSGTLSGSSTGQVLSDSSLSVVPNGSFGTDISVNAMNSGSRDNSASAAALPLGSSSVFKFGSAATSSSVSFANAGDGISRSKTETSYGSLAGVPFGDSKSAVASSGSGLSGFAPSIVAGSTTSSRPSNDITDTSDKSPLVSSPFGGTSASVGSTLVATAASGTVTSNGPLGDSPPVGTSPATGILGTAASASTGNSLFSAAASVKPSESIPFSFSANSTLPGLTSQAQVSNNALGSTQVAATGFATSTQSTPSQFGSSVSSPFGLNSSAAPAAAAAGSSVFGSSSLSNPFSSGTSFGATSSTPSSEPNKSVSSSANTSSPLFGSSWSTAPVFGSVSSSSASSSRFVFGASSSSGASTAGATAFGSSTNGTSSSSLFSFSAPAANPLPTQPVFGNPTATSSFSFASTQTTVTNDQMGMEDSMAEDTVQAATPSIPLFGQQTATPPPSSGFIFGSAVPPSSANPPLFGSAAPPSSGNTPLFGSAAVASPGIPFQFSGQPSMSGAPQAAAPFQASSSLEIKPGSFSLGTGDKSNRRIVKVRKSSRKK